MCRDGHAGRPVRWIESILYNRVAEKCSPDLAPPTPEVDAKDQPTVVMSPTLDAAPSTHNSE